MKQPREYRTRADPFEDKWAEIVERLKEPELEIKTIFRELQDKYPGQFQDGQLRTLQRHARQWRALHGAEKEVFFPQVHKPGQQGLSDFTSMNDLGLTIRGEPFEHLCYHFVMSWSNWEYAETAFSESFAALSRGLQNALQTLGGAPREHRTDNLSAATHDLRKGLPTSAGQRKEAGRAFNERYRRLVEHYRMEPTRNNPGRGHENGDVEKGHDVFKSELKQQLLLRGSSDFDSREDYEAFRASLIGRQNDRRREKIEEERRVLQPLPANRLEDFQVLVVRVSKTSTVRVASNAYSVPSTLIGHEVRVHVHAERIEAFYGSKLILNADRLRGEGGARINYRHIIGWLIRKPKAFRNYVYREELFPSLVFRRAYDLLQQTNPEQAVVEYLRLLKLAAKNLESSVAAELEKRLAEGLPITSEELQEAVAPRPAERPQINVREPNLSDYDALIEEEAA